MRRFGARTGLWVPLVARGRTIGLLAAHDKLVPDAALHRQRPPPRRDVRRRARPSPSISRERVARDALRRVVEAQELERRRLARELHDETGQALTSILLGLKALEDAVGSDEARAAVADLRELVVATLQDVRRLAVELRPEGARRLRPRAGARAADRDVRRADGDRRSLRERRSATSGLPAEVETALYRIVQEALTNVVKHAHARAVSIVLARKPDTVALVIEDDGRGFDPATTPRRRLRARGDARARRRCSTASSRSSRDAGARHDDRRRGAAADERARADRRRPRGRPRGPAPAARRRGRPRGGRRGGHRARRGLRGARDEAGRDPARRRHARPERARRAPDAPARASGDEGARALDAGRPAATSARRSPSARAATC